MAQKVSPEKHVDGMAEILEDLANNTASQTIFLPSFAFKMQRSFSVSSTLNKNIRREPNYATSVFSDAAGDLLCQAQNFNILQLPNRRMYSMNFVGPKDVLASAQQRVNEKYFCLKMVTGLCIKLE